MPCFFHYIAVSLSCFAVPCTFFRLEGRFSHRFGPFILTFACVCVCLGGGGGLEMTFFNFLYYVKAKEVGVLSKLCLNHFQIPSVLVHNSYKLTGKYFLVCSVALAFVFSAILKSRVSQDLPITKSSSTFVPDEEYHCSTHQQKARTLLFSMMLHSNRFDVIHSYTASFSSGSRPGHKVSGTRSNSQI